MMSLIDRAYGSLLGLMVGDAFGAQVEGTSGALLKELFPFGIREMGSRIRSFEEGTVTDDSEMALLMAASLVANDGFNVVDLRRRYVAWIDTDPPGIGSTTYQALKNDYFLHLRWTNGALMRVAPLGIWGTRVSEEELLEIAREECKLTHVHRFCQEANQLWALGLRKAILEGSSKEEIYTYLLELADRIEIDPSLKKVLVLAGTQPPVVDGPDKGWVTVSFQQALYSVLHATSIEDEIRAITMRGGDTDTNAAIYGMMAGAIHGSEAIPRRWVEALKPSSSLLELLGSRAAKLDALAYDLAVGLLG